MNQAAAPSARLRRPTMPDMVPQGFRVRGEALPRSRPPRWMTWTWVAAAAATIAILAATMLGPMDEFVLAGGVVRPAEYALVFPLVEGTVAEVVVQSGQQVRAGDVLARLDTFDLERERGEIRAGLAQSEADRAMAGADLAAVRAAPLPPELLFQARTLPRQREAVAMRRDVLARLESLADRQLVSVLELTRERLAVQEAELAVERSAQADALLAGEYARAQVAVVEARLRAAEGRGAALAARTVELERELDRRIVRAPADGVVIGRSVRFPGEKVAIGTALFKVAYGSATRLRLYASEDRVDRMQPGMIVRFRPRSDPDRLRPYSVGRIVEVAIDRDLGDERVESGTPTGSYAIDVEVQRAESELPLGAAVDAEIVLGEQPFWRGLLMKSAPTAK